jgi:hypothetical protein
VSPYVYWISVSAENQEIAESGYENVGYGASGYGLGGYEAYGPKVLAATKSVGKFIGIQNAYGLNSTKSVTVASSMKKLP